LRALCKLDPQQGRIVELRFFAGLSNRENYAGDTECFRNYFKLNGADRLM
jgi:hypothetical protein